MAQKAKAPVRYSTRDSLGRITEKSETLAGDTTTYAYDLGGRLIEVRRNAVLTQSWTCDANGNRTQTLGQPVAAYDAQDRQPYFFAATESLYYLDALAKAARQLGGSLIAYVLSTRHLLCIC